MDDNTRKQLCIYDDDSLIRIGPTCVWCHTELTTSEAMVLLYIGICTRFQFECEDECWLEDEAELMALCCKIKSLKTLYTILRSLKAKGFIISRRGLTIGRRRNKNITKYQLTRKLWVSYMSIGTPQPLRLVVNK